MQPLYITTGFTSVIQIDRTTVKTLHLHVEHDYEFRLCVAAPMDTEALSDTAVYFIRSDDRLPVALGTISKTEGLTFFETAIAGLADVGLNELSELADSAWKFWVNYGVFRHELAPEHKQLEQALLAMPVIPESSDHFGWSTTLPDDARLEIWDPASGCTYYVATCELPAEFALREVAEAFPDGYENPDGEAVVSQITDRQDSESHYFRHSGADGEFQWNVDRPENFGA